jgi:hypothetical protein
MSLAAFQNGVRKVSSTLLSSLKFNSIGLQFLSINYKEKVFHNSKGLT